MLSAAINESSASAVRSCSSASYSLTACLIAPQFWWPSTTKSRTPSTSTAYSNEAITASSMTCPAVRTVNRSPMPASKMMSGLTRASEQLSTAASGSCVSTTASRASALRFGCSGLPSANLRLPANMRLHTPLAVPSTSFWSTNSSSSSAISLPCSAIHIILGGAAYEFIRGMTAVISREWRKQDCLSARYRW